MLGGYGKGTASGAGGGFYKNNYAMDDYEDDDDMNDYGDQQYEEDSDDGAGEQYMGNYPSGALFQNQPKMGGAALGVGGYPSGGISSASGVPFYGQQSKMAAPMTYGAASSFGAMGGSGGFQGGTQFGASTSSGGGGFTYGMASKGGNLFGGPATTSTAGGTSNLYSGGTQFGATSTSQSNPGLFQFGSASQFGGIGGGTTFGAGSMFGATAAVADDPYANIALDLNKVKSQPVPSKLHEHKSEEEKKKEKEEREAKVALGNKSNLKKDTDEDKEKGKKRNVTFGKSTTYEVERGEAEESGEFYNKESVNEGKGSPRPAGKKVIEEKDLSDGRSEKEKILAMLEQKQREQLEEIKEINELKSKQDQKSNVEDSVGESSSSNPIASNATKKTAQVENSSSYESDDFEDISASGSGSKSKLTYWPGKDHFKKDDPEPASKSKKDEVDEYNPNAMEEYLKKQQQLKAGGAPVQKPPAAPIKSDYSESSDRYDDDFESLSKSQTQLTASMLTGQPSQQQNQQKPQLQQQQQAATQNKTFEYQPLSDFKTQIDKYVKKENKFIQTEEGKYNFMQPSDLTSGTYKEWTLQQNLKDAENVIQDLKAQQAEQKQKIFNLESQFKKKDVEFQTMRREALNAQETSKRLQEQLKDAVHKNNLYKIETEELIKQIDLADAKTREKEDDLKLMQAEYDRKMKLQEERILMRRSKNEERTTYEVKRQHMLEIDELQKKLDDQKEELDYYMQKVTKIEAENASLRLGKDQFKRIKELEDQVEELKSQLQQEMQLNPYQKLKENMNVRNLQGAANGKDTETNQKEVKLQREIQQLELIIKGFQEENEKAVSKQKQLEKDLRAAQERIIQEQNKVMQLKQTSTKQDQRTLLQKDEIYVETQKQEVDMQTVNTMGASNAITLQQLQDFHAQIKNLQQEKFEQEKLLIVRDEQLKSQYRDEKAIIEKQLMENQYLVNEKEREIERIRADFEKSRKESNDKISELEDKVMFFRQNQKLLTEDDEYKKQAMQELQSLREKTRRLEEESKKAKDLEKKCRLLEETIKSKNPNNIPMLLQAVKETSNQERSSNSQWQERVRDLEYQLEEKDRNFEKKLRALRQEQERLKNMYENRKGQTPEAKRIAELEDELQNTKIYYNKRIREIEDKYKFRMPSKEDKDIKKGGSKTLSEGKSLSGKPPVSSAGGDQGKQQLYEETIEKLTKERNLLAQKVVNLETANNRRRQSFQGGISFVDETKPALSAIYSIAQLIKQNAEQREIASNLIESAVSCVEQLKVKDPQKNKQLSQLLLTLTQDLSTTSRINERIVNDILDCCKSDLGQVNQSQQDPKFRRMASAGQDLNKDLSGVINFYPKDQKLTSKPPKPAFSNPFAVKDQNSSPQQKQPSQQKVKDLLRQIVHSGVDFERIVQEKRLNPQKVPLNQLYQILREESTLKNISLDEVKALSRFVKEKSVYASELQGVSQDDIDVNDLANVVMDVSLEIFGNNPTGLGDETVKVTDSLIGGHGGANRYSQDFKKEPKGRGDEFTERLNLEKIDRMQKVMSDLQYEKRQLQDKVDQLEAGKQRMERILKQNIGVKSTMKKTLGATGNTDIDSSEFIDELSLLMKRIEFLEQQSDERLKQSSLEHGPCKREIQRLTQELDSERNDKMRMLAQKNSEVAYFKSELDALLTEMKFTMAQKAQSRSVRS